MAVTGLRLYPSPEKAEIASNSTDRLAEYNIYSNTLENPDKILKTELTAQGIDYYEDITRDAQISATLQTRIWSVIGREWDLTPASDSPQDIEIADFVKYAFGRFNFDAARAALMKGIVTGFKPAEIIWERDSSGKILIRDIKGRRPGRFVFSKEEQMRMLTIEQYTDGIELPDKKFIVFRNPSSNASPYGDALGRALYWPWWFKRNGLEFWLRFCDKYGSPTVVGKYPMGTPKDDITALRSVLAAIKQESAITMPDTQMIELLTAKHSGSVTTYQDLCSYMDREISKIVLGQTLTTELGSSGSYAASQTHNEVRKEIMKADADLLCETLNSTLIQWLIDYNFPGVTEYPKMWINLEEEEDLTQTIEQLEKLHAMGLSIPEEWIYDKFSIPIPAAGDDVLVKAAPEPDAMPGDEGEDEDGSPMSFAEGGSSLNKIVKTQGNIDALILETLGIGEVKYSELLRIVNSVDNYEDLSTSIFDLMAGADMAAFTEALSQALFIADLNGRALNA